MTAFVRVCGPPNSAYLVGYPGISATLVSEEGMERMDSVEAAPRYFGQGLC